MLDPSFDNHTTEYKTEIQAKTDSVNIFAVPENEKASVQIIGNDYIKVPLSFYYLKLQILLYY